MANKSIANGFYYDQRLSDQSPAVHDYPMTASLTLNPGDPVTLTSGKLAFAGTNVPVLGVVLGPAAVDAGVYDNAGPIVAGAGENPMVKVLIATADTLFRAHDAAAAPTDALVGATVDMVGTTGETGLNSGVVTNGDFQIFDKAGTDNIAGNEYGADMQWLGFFANRFFV